MFSSGAQTDSVGAALLYLEPHSYQSMHRINRCSNDSVVRLQRSGDFRIVALLVVETVEKLAGAGYSDGGVVQVQQNGVAASKRIVEAAMKVPLADIADDKHSSCTLHTQPYMAD